MLYGLGRDFLGGAVARYWWYVRASSFSLLKTETMIISGPPLHWLRTIWAPSVWSISHPPRDILFLTSLLVTRFSSKRIPSLSKTEWCPTQPILALSTVLEPTMELSVQSFRWVSVIRSHDSRQRGLHKHCQHSASPRYLTDVLWVDDIDNLFSFFERAILEHLFDDSFQRPRVWMGT